MAFTDSAPASDNYTPAQAEIDLLARARRALEERRL
jgi:hypothetical protein